MIGSKMMNSKTTFVTVNPSNASGGSSLSTDSKTTFVTVNQ